MQDQSMLSMTRSLSADIHSNFDNSPLATAALTFPFA
jgi:hypothetical protein